MTSETIKQVKANATEVIRSHGAFGESERYYEINPDKLIEEVVKVVEQVCRSSEEEYMKNQRDTQDFVDKNIFAEGRAASYNIRNIIRSMFPKPKDQT